MITRRAVARFSIYSVIYLCFVAGLFWFLKTIADALDK